VASRHVPHSRSSPARDSEHRLTINYSHSIPECSQFGTPLRSRTPEPARLTQRHDSSRAYGVKRLRHSGRPPRDRQSEYRDAVDRLSRDELRPEGSHTAEGSRGVRQASGYCSRGGR